MAQWFRYDDRPEGEHPREDRLARSARPGRDDRSWFERGKDEVRSWTHDDDDDEDDVDRVRYRRPRVDEGPIAVSGTRPDWLDRSQHHRVLDSESQSHRVTPPIARSEAYDNDWQKSGSSSSTFWMVPGPHVGRGPNGYRRSDERILEDVCERLMQHGRIDARNLDVIVSNGEVTLRGTVPSRDMKRAAEDVAESVFGVADVRNEIKTAGAPQQVAGSTDRRPESPQDC